MNLPQAAAPLADFRFWRRIGLTGALALLSLGRAFAQTSVEWVATTAAASWVQQPALRPVLAAGPADAEVSLTQPQQTIDGFGGCFNELGWTALSALPAAGREQVLRELFAPGVGANFTICRLPVGANDFSRDWYSYDETPGDFALKNFSIAPDEQTLIPFIKSAQRYNARLKLWASPWSPPTWMKTNHHYAEAAVTAEVRRQMPGADNGLRPEQVGREGSNLFIQEDKYLAAYALYFAKFIDAYRQQGIRVGMVMPQNEFNSAQVFPSCTWTAGALARFVGAYLGPQMRPRGVDVFFGTLERANEVLVDTALHDARSGPFIKGVGFQWAGKGAIAGIHRRYPNLTLYQSEQECGDGQNDWQYCAYTWTLMKHYLSSGANAYLYWNIALKQGGVSRWGWRQNSLVTVDETARTYHFNYEYYLLKHLSHYVQPGARRLTTSGAFADLLAFQNPDQSVVIVAQNEGLENRPLRIKVGGQVLAPVLAANSFNTLLLKKGGPAPR